jgi:hypothetical protein
MPLEQAGWLLRGELDPDDLPDDFGPVIENMLKVGFSFLRCTDDED